VASVKSLDRTRFFVFRLQSLFRRLLLLLLLLLHERKALGFFPAFGTFLSVVSAFVVSHKYDLRPLVSPEQRERHDR
jgi:hypothetical protein